MNQTRIRIGDAGSFTGDHDRDVQTRTYYAAGELGQESFV